MKTISCASMTSMAGKNSASSMRGWMAMNECPAEPGHSMFPGGEKSVDHRDNLAWAVKSNSQR